LRTIMNTAVADDLIAANPCRVRGSGQTRRVKKIVPATLAELETLTKAMPGKYQLLVLLAAWCGLRFGELAELRRSDINLTNGAIHVRRGVVRTNAGRVVKDPKSDAGKTHRRPPAAPAAGGDRPPPPACRDGPRRAAIPRRARRATRTVHRVPRVLPGAQQGRA